MRHLISASIIYLAFSVHVYAEPTYNMTATAVDEQGDSIAIEMLRWSQNSAPQKKHYMNCMNSDCTEWQGDTALSEAMTIEATGSKKNQQNPECDDLYMGELSVDQDSYHSGSNVIVMKAMEIVCP